MVTTENKRLALAAIALSLFIALMAVNNSITHAQSYPQSFELTCPVGSSPISGPTGVSWNPTTGRYRANFCMDANGNISTNLVSSSNLTGQSANIGPISLITPNVNGFYRASCSVVLTQAATTSSTLPNCVITFTDPDTSIVQTTTLTATSTNNVVGTIGPMSTAAAGLLNPWFYAKSGVAITYSTSNYASVGGTVMQYSVRVRLEFIGP